METHYLLDVSMEVKDEDGDIFSTESEVNEFPTLAKLIEFMNGFAPLVPNTKVFHFQYPDVTYRSTKGNNTRVFVPHGMSTQEKKIIYIKAQKDIDESNRNLVRSILESDDLEQFRRDLIARGFDLSEYTDEELQKELDEFTDESGVGMYGVS